MTRIKVLIILLLVFVLGYNNCMKAIIKDANTYVPKSQLVTSDKIGREQIQRNDEDWSNIPISYFTYSSSNAITIDGFLPSDYFQVGDILWIKQNDEEKYFYIYDVGDSYINVDAGDDYTLTSHSFQFVRFSRMPNPSGFPGKFRYTPTLSQENDTPTINGGTIVEYKMIGNLVIISGDLIWSEATGVDSAIFVTYPFPLRTGKSTWFGIVIAPLIYSPVADLVQVSFGENGVGGIENIYVWNEGDFIPAGGNELYLNFSYYH